ncbi:MAG: hypothetical protein AAGD06_28745 [Acidobacteriota bacterium]
MHRYSLSRSILIVLSALALPTATVLAQPFIEVPGDMSLQAAIANVDDGGIIEIAAGTYPSPSGGFSISNLGKGFTVRAAAGATVVLDGGGVRDVVRFRNTTFANGGPVVFENLTFANGFSGTDAIGTVTVTEAAATFIGCTFRNHLGEPPNTSSGAVHVVSNSLAYFDDCTFEDNVSRNAGAGIAIQAATVWVHDSYFVNNRTNLPNHRVTAAGGAIHVGSSEGTDGAQLFVTNSRFENNQAGAFGGAIFGIGDYSSISSPPDGTGRPPISPLTQMTVSNSTFVGNRAINDASVPQTLPTEGGAFNAENDTLARIYHSRFLSNESDVGGGVNTYRATVEIEDSVFRGNRAVGVPSSQGFGGAISGNSNDVNNATTNFGAINRPSASISVTRSFFQGRFGGTTTSGNAGGAIFTAGDNNRQYGQGGVAQMGGVNQNRATLNLDGNVFYDLDTLDPATGGKGGGVFVNLVDLDFDDSLLIDNDALGTNGQGGAFNFVNQTDANVSGLTFANNTAQLFGGAILAQGSVFSLQGSDFFDNEVSPGTGEPVSQSTGAAIFAGPDIGRSLDITGTASGNTFSRDVGMPLWDDDRPTTGPFNKMRWNGNSIFNTTFGSTVYFSNGNGFHDVAGLNGLVVNHNGSNFDKSTVNNTAPGSAPVQGSIRAVPGAIVPVRPTADPETATEVFLAYAWSGGSATVNGTPVSGSTGFDGAVPAGTYTLSVAGNNFVSNVTQAAAPAASFTASPSAIPDGGSTQLSWSVTGGTFVDMSIDQGVPFTPGATGSVTVSPADTTTYRLFVSTKEGGVVVPVTVLVGVTDLIFEDGFESGNLTSWSTIFP